MFALKLLRFADHSEFSDVEANPKRTHDGGVDFYRRGTDGAISLAGQSKYKVRSVEEFDSVVSKFAAFAAGLIDEFSELDDKPTDEAVARSLAVADALDRRLVETSNALRSYIGRRSASRSNICSTSSVTTALRKRCSN